MTNKKIAIITGDIVNSEQYATSAWMPRLKQLLLQKGKQPEVWDIYRGDEFQLKTTPAAALKDAILIKSVIKTVKNLDIRLAIGLGDESYSGGRITEANGSAYQRSGRLFEMLKTEKTSLAIDSGEIERDNTLNLMIRLALSFMDEWTTVSAETVGWTLMNPNSSQQEMAAYFDIQQSAVSQRQKRARTDLVQELLAFYNLSLNQLAWPSS